MYFFDFFSNKSVKF